MGLRSLIAGLVLGASIAAGCAGTRVEEPLPQKISLEESVEDEVEANIGFEGDFSDKEKKLIHHSINIIEEKYPFYFDVFFVKGEGDTFNDEQIGGRAYAGLGSKEKDKEGFIKFFGQELYNKYRGKDVVVMRDFSFSKLHESNKDALWNSVYVRGFSAEGSYMRQVSHEAFHLFFDRIKTDELIRKLYEIDLKYEVYRKGSRRSHPGHPSFYTFFYSGSPDMDAAMREKSANEFSADTKALEVLRYIPKKTRDAAFNEKREELDMAMIVGNLINKQKKGLYVTKYAEIAPFIEDVVKDLTGEDVSHITGHVMEKEEYERKWNFDGTAGRFLPFRNETYVMQSNVNGVLSIGFHEIGHYVTRQAKDIKTKEILALVKEMGRRLERDTNYVLSGDSEAMFQKLKRLRERKFTRKELEEGLMEEAGAMAFERWAMWYTQEKFEEIGTNRVIIRPSSEINKHFVAEDMCTEVYNSLLEPGKSELDALKETFGFMATANYDYIREFLSAGVQERAETFFRMQLNMQEGATFAPKLYTNPVDAAMGRHAPMLKGMERAIIQAGISFLIRHKDEFDDEDPLGGFDLNENGKGAQLADKLLEQLTEGDYNKNTLLIVNTGATHTNAIARKLQDKYNVYFISEGPYIFSYKAFMEERNI